MIELAPHQIEAVDRIAALFERFGGAILADEAGLGKSFVAAAVAAAHRGEAEVIVPSSLGMQWRETLDAFGVAAGFITHDSLCGGPVGPRPDGDRELIAAAP